MTGNIIDVLYQALGAECRAIVPDAKVYRDNIPQNFAVPAFLILTVESSALRQLADRQKMTHQFDVQYFPDGELQDYRQKCEQVKQEMLRHFDVINADGISFYVRNRTTNITDDVLHMLCTVSYVEYEPYTGAKMEELKTIPEMEDTNGRSMGNAK